MKKIKIVQLNSELGAGTRGSSLGNKALEIAALNEGDDFFNKYPSTIVKNENHMLYEHTSTKEAKYIDGIITIHERLRKEIETTLKTGTHFPILLAGDHSSSAGSIAGVKSAFPEKRIGIIWVDAHGDLHSPFSTPSGNMHGMPLAMALNLDNLQFQINNPSEETLSSWERLKNSGNIAPKALIEDVVFFGVRDIEDAEEHLINDGGVRNYTVSEIREKGVTNCVESALTRLEECDLIYLSFDVDSMDCDVVSKGTGTPVPNGLLPDETKEILQLLVRSGKIACFDMVEVNPILDNKGNAMAETAFQILKSVTKTIESMLNQSEIAN